MKLWKTIFWLFPETLISAPVAHKSPMTNQRLSLWEMWQASVPKVDPPGAIKTFSGKSCKKVVMSFFDSYECYPFSILTSNI